MIRQLSFTVRQKLALIKRYIQSPLEGRPSSQYWKQSGVLLLDLCVIPLAFFLAVTARWGGLVHQYALVDVIAVTATMAFSMVYFRRIGFYRAIIRFMGQQAVITVVKGVSASAVFLAVACFLLRSEVPRSTPFIYWGVAFILIGGSRLAVRAIYQSVLHHAGDNVAIYGAGVSGRQLLMALYHSGAHRPVVFIDDNRALEGSVIHGVSVFHPDRLPVLIDEFALTHVYLALPSADRKRRRDIINELEDLPVHVKTVPDFSALMSGSAKVSQVEDIDLEDLLGRDPVPPEQQLLEQCIRDKVVMVTGGGGSIGSELCRQIIRCQPKELILFELSEFALYAICKDLEQLQAAEQHKVPVVPLMGSVRNQHRLEMIYREFAVQTVYHAAAYKHVPMVEYNMAEGVANNVFGTLAAGKAAVNAGVDTFVLISTDKAVRPTNVMGASKRMAELVLQAFAEKYPATRFCMVRFGNVLGSSGSVVPLFRKQIMAGGPVTVTHKDIIRYFMTIPEAAQLVLQASAMGKGGDVFVLDMGEPVSIVALARRLVRLMGCEIKDETHPKGEIEIQFTGLRPGEKLYEELLLGENVLGTGHPKIMRAEEVFLTETVLDKHLSELRLACENNDCERIQQILLEAVSGFDAKDGISDAMWCRRLENGSIAQLNNIVEGSFSKPS